MPTDLSALVVLIAAIFPGVAGEVIYRAFIGVVSWRDTAINNTFRVLGFSLGGATLYAFAARFLGFPPPSHLFPSTLKQFGPDTYFTFFGPYVGHLVCSAIVGFGVVGLVRLFFKFSPVRTSHTVWDEFVLERASNRWVVVSLKNDKAYIGKLVSAEHLVQLGERDITLGEPAFWSQEDYNYIALGYQYLYLPASTIDSIGAYSRPDDERLVAVGDKVFKELVNDEAKAPTRP